MKQPFLLAAIVTGVIFVAGCSTPLPPGAERGPNNTMAYYVHVEANGPARVEVNGEDVGVAPVRLKLFGDPDGTFHDFGSSYYVIRALATATNQYTQTKVFHTGHMFGPEDRIPERVYFDLNQPATPPQGYPGAAYGPSPVYIAPPFYYYPGPYYYGPRMHFHFGHGHRRR